MRTKLVTLATLTGAALISTSASVVMAQTANTNNISDAEFARMYAEMDTNKNGLISRAEYAHYYNMRFDTWDSPHRGMMTREQIRTKMFERELRKTDGNPQGNSILSGSVVRK